MKQRARLLTGLLAYGATAAMALSLTTLADPASAKVQAIRSGGAQYSTDGSTWNTVQVGATLHAGASIRTDAAGVVDLNLGRNGPALRMTPGTTLVIRTLQLMEGAGETIADTQLDLPNGKIHAIVRKVGASSRYEVRTPVSTCGVRGTDISVTSRGDLVVEKGTGYALYTPPGQTEAREFQVPGGYMFDPALNNNNGGVIETLPSLKLELERATGELQQFVAAEGRGQRWAPVPFWETPGRQGVEVGNEGDGPWELPPVVNPSRVTTPVFGGGER